MSTLSIIRLGDSASARRILFSTAITLVVGGYGALSLWHLSIEFRISRFGVEAPATVIKVEKVERDDGDRGWIEELINYSFYTPDGYLFSGVNAANQSETERLIGRPNAAGKYDSAIVEYLPQNPRWHRLKGWGYEGYGPPGGVLSFALRATIPLGLIALAVALAFSLGPTVGHV